MHYEQRPWGSCITERPVMAYTCHKFNGIGRGCKKGICRHLFNMASQWVKDTGEKAGLATMDYDHDCSMCDQYDPITERDY